jgi:hypothetical protein
MADPGLVKSIDILLRETEFAAMILGDGELDPDRARVARPNERSAAMFKASRRAVRSPECNQR